ncbi:hypothetical protein [Brenneria uluponensis]|uniref:hypothetical protein n=1 Tax=Brenneria uluponensis TaxID=3057057 RepID=UPI0028E7C15B|nr:hypothetical protein [Brenneria ulupoensis]
MKEDAWRLSMLGTEACMHSPLDVIGGRITATYFAIDNLSNPDNTRLKADSRAQALAYFTSHYKVSALKSASFFQ